MTEQQNGDQKQQTRSLEGKKVAILVTDGFEQVELTEPRKALDAAGAQTSIASPKQDKVRGWKFTDWGDELKVDVPLAQAKPDDFDALLLPGGVINPDKLRMNDEAVATSAPSFPSPRRAARTSASPPGTCWVRSCCACERKL
jgi:protease I